MNDTTKWVAIQNIVVAGFICLLISSCWQQTHEATEKDRDRQFECVKLGGFWNNGRCNIPTPVPQSGALPGR